MSFEVLDAANEQERARWLTLWESTSEQDPYSHPTYGALFAKDTERLVCATWNASSGVILFPLILRSVDALEWADAPGTWDATTPYGYGGPVGQGEDVSASFYPILQEWLVANQVVTVFARLSVIPALRRPPPAPWVVTERGSNIVRSLDLPLEDLWMSYAHKVRKNVKRARKNDLRCEVDESGEYLDAFIDIYESTLDRRDARDTYYFSRPFFERLASLGTTSLFCHVWKGDEMVSSELVLRSATTIYSYLGGTLAHAFPLRPNDLLKHTLNEWGAKNGLSSFVLGGGYQPNDGIFQYKRAFAPEGEVPFFIATLVVNEKIQTGLLQQRASWEEKQRRAWEPNAEHFPSYRA